MLDVAAICRIAIIDLHVREHEVPLRPVHVIRHHDEDDGGTGVGVGLADGGHGAPEVVSLHQLQTVTRGQVGPIVSPVQRPSSYLQSWFIEILASKRSNATFLVI